MPQIKSYSFTYVLTYTRAKGSRRRSWTYPFISNINHYNTIKYVSRQQQTSLLLLQYNNPFNYQLALR